MHLGTAMLTKLGYKVLSANSPKEAIQLADENQGRINLLLTDIIMPGMNGRDLSKMLLLANPDMKCLFMSGYTTDVMSGLGDTEKNTSFLQKPFNMDSLSAKVREALTGKL
jgi:DNA-binding NtrC family response regulator